MKTKIVAHQAIWQKLNDYRVECQSCRQILRIGQKEGYIFCNYHVIPQIICDLIECDRGAVISKIRLNLQHRRFHEHEIIV